MNNEFSNDPILKSQSILEADAFLVCTPSVTASPAVLHAGQSPQNGRMTVVAIASVIHDGHASILNSSTIPLSIALMTRNAIANLVAYSSLTSQSINITNGSATLGSSATLTPTGIRIRGVPISGGILAGGSAIVTNSAVNLSASGGVSIGGSSQFNFNVIVGTSGGVSIGGSSSSHPTFRNVSQGGIVIGGNQASVGNLSFTLGYEFSWRTNQSATASYEFAWSTGEQRSYFYRVVGKGKTDVCNPLQADECCKKFVINIQARSIEDVCAKLRARIGVWPIEKIQRFTRPAQTSAIAEDAANGITYECNEAVDVDYCKIPLCADFCVLYDLREDWGGYSVLEYTSVAAMGVQMLTISRKHEHTSTGSLKISGHAKTKNIREFSVVAKQSKKKIGGYAEVVSSNYTHISRGGLKIDGSAGRIASFWNYSGGKWPHRVGPIKPKYVSGWDAYSDGSYRCQLTSENNPAISLSGFEIPKKDLMGVVAEVKRSANGLVQESEFSVNGKNVTQEYSWPIGIPTTVVHRCNEINSIDIKVRPLALTPGLTATIHDIGIHLLYDRGGSLKIGGKAKIACSHRSFRAKGSLRLGGYALSAMSLPEPLPLKPVRATSYVPPSSSKGMIIRALSTTTTTTITPMPQAIVPEAKRLANTLTKCNCFDMPLIIPFSHNLAGANKLSEFVKRNNQSIPKFINLQHNKTNDSWQCNMRYSGISALTNGMETWNLLFELQCSEFLGGTQIGQGVWKFGMKVNQRNLATGQDFDTRLLVAFLPDPICSKGKEFRAKLTFDTTLGVATTTPIATIYEVVVHDNIGLFKSDSWINNPKLIIDMSQSALPTDPQRLPYILV